MKSESNEINHSQQDYNVKANLLVKDDVHLNTKGGRNTSESSFDFWKAVDWVKEKCIELKNNESFRTCLNPFRHDEDPTMRYVYYCLSATAAFILFLLIYFILSTE